MCYHVDMTQALEVPAKHPGGRPTKYRSDVPQRLISLMSEGLSKEAAAAELEIHKDTLYEWIEKYQELSDAEKIGTAKSRLFWERTGIRGAVGDLEKFNSASWIFNMKNRFGWRDMSQVEHTGHVETTVNIALSPHKQNQVIDADYDLIEAPDEYQAET